MIKKTYYELLNISEDATIDNVEKAYKRVKDLYSDGSDALYSLVSKEERQGILTELEKAHAILTDPEKREVYDVEIDKTKNERIVTPEVDLSSILHTEDSAINKPPLKAVISDFTHSATLIKPLIIFDESMRMLNEQYRILFTRLEDIFIKKSNNVFAITSSVKGEGKTMTSIYLTSVMAATFGKKTLLIEADIRRPTFSSYFTWDKGTPGLRDVLNGSVEAVDAVMKLKNSLLHIIHAGRNVPATEPINAVRMSELIKTFKDQFEYIVIDCTPIIPLADINIISRVVDGILLVVRAGETQRATVLKASKMIASENILGIVLNQAYASTLSLQDYYY